MEPRMRFEQRIETSNQGKDPTMLVLSRRVNQKIVLPTIQTTIQIVSTKSGTVRVGIEAPRNVPVFRAEVLDQESRDPAPLPPTDPSLRALLHQLNNNLNSSNIGLALLYRQLELGKTQEMFGTIDKIKQEIAALEEHLTTLAAATPPPLPPPLRRALLVEDNPNECELLAGFLRLAGLDVATAGDGADALDHLGNDPETDIVLLDMLLPRCDGPTTVRAIRGNPAHKRLRIFGLTGANPQDFGLPEGPTGVDRWFHKPFNPQTLLQELRQAAQASPE